LFKFLFVLNRKNLFLRTQSAVFDHKEKFHAQCLFALNVKRIKHYTHQKTMRPLAAVLIGRILIERQKTTLALPRAKLKCIEGVNTWKHQLISIFAENAKQKLIVVNYVQRSIGKKGTQKNVECLTKTKRLMLQLCLFLIMCQKRAKFVACTIMQQFMCQNKNKQSLARLLILFNIKNDIFLPTLQQFPTCPICIVV
jgi:hypothetical protein